MCISKVATKFSKQSEEYLAFNRIHENTAFLMGTSAMCFSANIGAIVNRGVTVPF